MSRRYSLLLVLLVAAICVGNADAAVNITWEYRPNNSVLIAHYTGATPDAPWTICSRWNCQGFTVDHSGNGDASVAVVVGLVSDPPGTVFHGDLLDDGGNPVSSSQDFIFSAPVTDPIITVVPVYGDGILSGLVSVVETVFPYAAAITAFIIGILLVRRWLGSARV